MTIEAQNRVRHVSGCLKYPDSEQNKERQQLMQRERARQQMADPGLFITMAIKRRSAPPTEVVEKGQEYHRFSFGFPVVIKPHDGRKMILAENQSEVIEATKGLKSTGYQIQKYLRGYTFLKVRIEEGYIEEGHPVYVSGAIRSLVKLYVTQGVCNFTLTVATNHVTTYVIGGHLK